MRTWFLPNFLSSPPLQAAGLKNESSIQADHLSQLSRIFNENKNGNGSLWDKETFKEVTWITQPAGGMRIFLLES